MKVKGTWLTDYVILIRKFIKDNPDKKDEFDKFLTPDDWEKINKWILATDLYPYEFFQRVGNAVYVIIAGKNKRLTQNFGRLFFTNLIKVYKTLIVTSDPVATLEKFAGFHQAYFRSVESKTFLIESGRKTALMRLKLTDSDKENPGAEGMAYQLAGTFQECVSQSGGINPQVKTVKEEDGNYLFTIIWE